MPFWKRREPKRVFYVSGKEVQPQHFGRMAVDVACRAYPDFISKLDRFSDRTLTQGESLFQILVCEHPAYLRFHFFAFIIAPFFAFARDVSKVPESIYLRVAAGAVLGLWERADLTGLQLTEEEMQALSSQIVKYASLVFSERDGANNPASKLFANCMFSTAGDQTSADEHFSVVELVILTKLLDEEILECLDALKRLDVRYEEQDA